MSCNDCFTLNSSANHDLNFISTNQNKSFLRQSKILSISISHTYISTYVLNHCFGIFAQNNLKALATQFKPNPRAQFLQNLER